MAITECKECGGKLSDSAESCPHCGHKPSKKGFGCGSILLIFIGIIFLFAVFDPGSKDSNSNSSSSGGEPSAAAIGFIAIKKSMRDPDSFVLEEAFAVTGNDVVCYTYRAKNGFGGYTSGQAVFKNSSSTLKSSDQEGFRALWNKECNGKPGNDVAGGLNMLLN